MQNRIRKIIVVVNNTYEKWYFFEWKSTNCLYISLEYLVLFLNSTFKFITTRSISIILKKEKLYWINILVMLKLIYVNIFFYQVVNATLFIQYGLDSW